MQEIFKLHVLKQFSISTVVGFCCVQTAKANFFEESQSSIYLRNFLVDRHYDDVPNPDLGSWSQGITGRFESGYTDTPVQIGLDASVQYAVRLGEHNAERLDTVLPYDQAKGRQERDYLKAGATLKFKFHDSELKIGELYPKLPVAFIDDSRQLMTSYVGALFETKAIDHLKLSAGRITHINSREDDDDEKLSLFVGSGPRYESDGLNFLGLDYQFQPQISGAYWFGQLEDIYQQHYVNLTYSTDVGKNKFKLDARYFHNSEDGDAYYGKIDSQAYGVQSTLQQGAHTVIAGLQKNQGKSNFPTLAGYVPQPFLQSWSTLAFIKPEELTWHVLYSHDFNAMGMPGLKLTLRYLKGTDIAREGLKDNQESEKNIILSYFVPEGRFKGLGLEWRHIQTNTKYGTAYTAGADYVENRFITSYSYKF